MSLEDRKQAYMKRMLGFTLVFAILGCIVLIIAANYVSSVFTDALENAEKGVLGGSK